MKIVLSLFFLFGIHLTLSAADAKVEVVSPSVVKPPAQTASITAKNDRKAYANADKKDFVPPQVLQMARSRTARARAQRGETVRNSVPLHGDSQFEREVLKAGAGMEVRATERATLDGPGPGFGVCMAPAHLDFCSPLQQPVSIFYNPECPCKCLYRCDSFWFVRFCYLICGGEGRIVWGFGPGYSCRVMGSKCPGNPGWDPCPIERTPICSMP